MKRIRLLGVLALFATGGVAVAAPEYVPLQERAQGQSLAGSALLNDSLFTNPAAGAFSSVYSVDGTYFAQKSFEVSVFDTKTASTGGGIAYFHENVPGSSDSRQGGRIGLLGRVSDAIGIGVAGKMEWGPGFDGITDNMKDLDAGVLANFNVLQLGATVRNLFGGDMHYDQFREYALGGRLNYQQTLFLSAAATSKWGYLSPYQYGIGAEYVSPYYFGVKGGYRFQRVGADGQPMYDGAWQGNWSAGLSFVSPRISFHYAIQFAAVAGQSPEHTFGTTILF